MPAPQAAGAKEGLLPRACCAGLPGAGTGRRTAWHCRGFPLPGRGRAQPGWQRPRVPAAGSGPQEAGTCICRLQPRVMVAGTLRCLKLQPVDLMVKCEAYISLTLLLGPCCRAVGRRLGKLSTTLSRCSVRDEAATTGLARRAQRVVLAGRPARPLHLCTPWALAHGLLARAQPRHRCCSACSPPELVFPEPQSRWSRPAFLRLACGKVENTPSSLLPPRQPKPQTPGGSEREKIADQPGPGFLLGSCP